MMAAGGATRLEITTMQGILAATLLASLLGGVPAQESHSHARVSGDDATKELQHLADEAHKAGRIDNEISVREKLSEKARAEYALNPKPLTKYSLYNLILLNDLPLAVLLEGTHRWIEAEQMFRHNQVELARMQIAGNDIKSENQLLLAYLLASEGQQREANGICHHWKQKVRHLADGYLWAMKHDLPRIPPEQIEDTNEIEIAAWDLACGDPEDGLTLAAQQMAAHPYMLRSYTLLWEYYTAKGEFEKARKAEKDWTSIVTMPERTTPASLE
jgi:hypothetical protein